MSSASVSVFSEICRIVKTRRIIFYLIDEQLKIAHRDKILGNLWVLLEPLLMMVVLVLFYRLRNNTVVFSLYLLPGLISWDIFQKSIVGSTSCLRNNAELIKKFPLPMAIFPAAIVLHKVHDIIWGLGSYLIIFLGLSYFSASYLPIPWIGVFLPVWLILFLMLTLGLCYFVAGLGVLFNDMSDIITILLRIGFFINPVFLMIQNSMSLKMQTIYFLLNPIAGYMIYLRLLLPGGATLVNGFQIPIKHYPLYLGSISAFIFLTGLKFFSKRQRHYSKYL